MLDHENDPRILGKFCEQFIKKHLWWGKSQQNEVATHAGQKRHSSARFQC